MKTSSRYTIRCHDVGVCAPGQFVFRDNEAQEVMGFVSGVMHDEGRIEIMLFKPEPIERMRVKHTGRNPDYCSTPMSLHEVITYLEDILARDPIIADAWRKVIANL